MARFTGSVRRNRPIKGTIGGGGGKGNLRGRRPGTGDLTSTNTTTPTPTPPTRVITDPVTQTRDKGGAFTQEGWVNVPGGRVFVRPGDTMSEAIGQGKGLQVIAKTERARSAGGAYTQGGYVKTNETGRFSVASVRAGDTRSEVINMARARAGRSLGTGRAATQQKSLVSFRAGERASSAASARGRATPAARGVTARSTSVSRSTAGARTVVTSTGARATTTAAAKPAATRTAVKKAPVRRVAAPAVRRTAR